MSNKRRCIRNMQHEFDTIDETASHLIKQCDRCKVKKWVPRRTKLTDIYIVTAPIRA